MSITAEITVNGGITAEISVGGSINQSPVSLTGQTIIANQPIEFDTGQSIRRPNFIRYYDEVGNKFIDNLLRPETIILDTTYKIRMDAILLSFNNITVYYL